MIYISLGSNLGHRLDYLQRAVNLLRQRCLRDVVCSPVLETECLLLEGSPTSWNIPFLNMVVAGISDLNPQEMLVALKDIEHELGRPAHYKRWSPRVIDLDILMWDSVTLDAPNLKIPHPELYNRPFFTHLLAMMGLRQFYDKSTLRCFSASLVAFPRLVGVVNITMDSFSDGGKFADADKAAEQIQKLSKDGATIIEVGAQSTRPGAHMLTPEEEYAGLDAPLQKIMPILQDRSIALSVDTFRPFVIRKLLENYPVSWINDVSGTLDDEILSLIAEKKCRLCLMHSLTIPTDKQITLPPLSDCITEINLWAEKNIDRLEKLGFSKKSIIIDPGIGFGKSAYQDIGILCSVDALRTLGVDILVGHSRKSYIGNFSMQKASERDLETLAVSAFLKDKVDYLRVHNVADTMRFFVTDCVVKGACA